MVWQLSLIAAVVPHILMPPDYTVHHAIPLLAHLPALLPLALLPMAWHGLPKRDYCLPTWDPVVLHEETQQQYVAGRRELQSLLWATVSWQVSFEVLWSCSDTRLWCSVLSVLQDCLLSEKGASIKLLLLRFLGWGVFFYKRWLWFFTDFYKQLFLTMFFTVCVLIYGQLATLQSAHR